MHMLTDAAWQPYLNKQLIQDHRPAGLADIPMTIASWLAMMHLPCKIVQLDGCTGGHFLRYILQFILSLGL